MLRESGLVHDELSGRRRLYRLDAVPLIPVLAWLDQFDLTDGAWDRRLDALDTEVYRTRRDHARPSPPAAHQQEDIA